MIYFEPDNHKYISTDKDINWISATNLISYFKQPFDSESVALKCSRSKKSKWYGKTKDEILQAWKEESDRSCSLGTWYHAQREQDVLECESIERWGKQLLTVAPIIDTEGRKIAPEQKLFEGIYPEHFMYLESSGICGQSDRVEVYDNFVTIVDFKTNREIKSEGFKNWEGLKQMMKPPVNHLEDCNLIHYTLQLSLYMYMILKHNPSLKPGRLLLQHVIFEELNLKDQFGHAILKTDEDNNPIIKEVRDIYVPYMKKEIISILEYYKKNQLNVLNYLQK